LFIQDGELYKEIHRSQMPRHVFYKEILGVLAELGTKKR
jgi:putative ABC transport system ATP-binding protein